MKMLNQEKSVKEEIDEIISEIKRKDAPERYLLFIFGIFISTFSFNVFYNKYNIVTGGGTGLSIIFNHMYGIDESKFVFIIFGLLLILSFLLLGIKMSLRSVIGTILYPLFIKLTSYLAVYFNIGTDSILLIALYGGLLSGFSSGLILKTGFTTGGFNILYQIMNKYLKVSIGKASLMVNSIIIMLGCLVFGLPSAIYAIIALSISTFITDRVLLGVSNSKTFYIITEKDDEVKDYILRKLNHGVTVLNVKGGTHNNRKKMLMCVVPTREYFNLKEVVLKIDSDAFFLITDSYEVEGAI